jgi:pilus assembly protein Flp/PilA
MRLALMDRLVKQVLRDESGATAIEYSLIAAILALGLIAAVPILGSGVEEAFQAIADHLTAIN